MNILAIDIGTTTGWALGTRDGTVKGGSESFSPRRGEAPAQRWLRFRAFLNERRAESDIQVVYYERVLHHTAVQAAHIYGAFEALLQIWCEVNRIRYVSVSPMTIKKHWTGQGNVKKDAMIAEAERRGFRPSDDNHADAIALLFYGRAAEEGEIELTAKPPKKKASKKPAKVDTAQLSLEAA